MHAEITSAQVRREQMRGATDEYLRRPLWEIPPGERGAFLAERAARLGLPTGNDDFDTEYH